MIHTIIEYTKSAFRHGVKEADIHHAILHPVYDEIQDSGDGKSGFFMKHKNEIVILDNVSATWLRLKSETSRKSATEIISELVREKMAVGM